MPAVSHSLKFQLFKIEMQTKILVVYSSSSSIGAATLVGFGLLNDHWVFSAGRFYRVPLPGVCQTPNLEDQWLERSNSRHKMYPASEKTRADPSSGRWKLWVRKGREFCRKWRIPRHFWVLLHAINLRHGTDGFTSPPKEGALRIFSPEKSDGFGRVWTRELGYQRPARGTLDHRSR